MLIVTRSMAVLTPEEEVRRDINQHVGRWRSRRRREERIEPPVAADHRPVALQRFDGEGQEREEGTGPAQQHQCIGVDLADRRLAGHDIAAPEQVAQDQQQIGRDRGAEDRGAGGLAWVIFPLIDRFAAAEKPTGMPQPSHLYSARDWF